MSSNVILIGRLVKEIEVKKTRDQRDYGFVRLAVRREYKDKEGKYPTDFFNIAVFSENDIKNIKQYTQQGSLMAIHGHLQIKQGTSDEVGKSYINIVPNKFEFLSNPKGSTLKEEKELLQKDQPTLPEPEPSNEISNDDYFDDEYLL